MSKGDVWDLSNERGVKSSVEKKKMEKEDILFLVGVFVGWKKARKTGMRSVVIYKIGSMITSGK